MNIPASLLLVVGLIGLVSPTSPQVGQKRASDPRVETLLKEGDLKYSVDPDGDFKLLFEVGTKRTQAVWISSATSKLGQLEIREVFSVAYQSNAPFSAEIANKLLEQNFRMKLGSWQEGKIGDKFLAFYSAQIAADTDLATLRTTIGAVTSVADTMELELTSKDAF